MTDCVSRKTNNNYFFGFSFFGFSFVWFYPEKREALRVVPS
jgi:hypothetical protein